MRGSRRVVRRPHQVRTGRWLGKSEEGLVRDLDRGRCAAGAAIATTAIGTRIALAADTGKQAPATDTTTGMRANRAVSRHPQCPSATIRHPPALHVSGNQAWINQDVNQHPSGNRTLAPTQSVIQSNRFHRPHSQAALADQA
ncbi:hypothetical protein BCR44DRAFT_1443532 [Catenaria anguillulae PL171]|uniref:Uncharacterized protein n=1 Tax=Catenaria anguillulae PL171 TaxID=765915 RepID=A0A1Y2H8U9_9FUNG|nr:hypothetical protein BCR44DRAFT_1443532 [Catenaria anguillulae PL171]